MYVLEIVILILLFLLLYSTGWLFRIFQILIGILMDFGRSIVENSIRDQIERPEVKKRSKRSK
jgi:hypothetical protein